MTPPPGAPRGGFGCDEAATARARAPPAAAAAACDALTATAATHAHAHAPPPLEAQLRAAAWRALGGGLAGGGAMVCNVCALMCVCAPPCFPHPPSSCSGPAAAPPLRARTRAAISLMPARTRARAPARAGGCAPRCFASTRAG
jgi:hypothetical protein